MKNGVLTRHQSIGCHNPRLETPQTLVRSIEKPSWSVANKVYRRSREMQKNRAAINALTYALKGRQTCWVGAAYHQISPAPVRLGLQHRLPPALRPLHDQLVGGAVRLGRRRSAAAAECGRPRRPSWCGSATTSRARRTWTRPSPVRSWPATVGAGSDRRPTSGHIERDVTDLLAAFGGHGGRDLMGVELLQPSMASLWRDQRRHLP